MVAPGKTVSRLAAGARHVSKRLVASYVLDWILILYVWSYFIFIDVTHSKHVADYPLTEQPRRLAVHSV